MQKEFRSTITFFAYLLVLLAGVTFPGVLNAPGSFDEKGFMRTDRWKLYMFVHMNSLSFCFSMSALVLCLSGSLPPFPCSHTHEASRGELNEQMSDTTRFIARNVASTLFKLVCINIFFAVSLTCCVLAFLFATLGILKPDTDKVKPVEVTLGISVACTLVSVAWLLFQDSIRFLQRARFSLATLTDSLTRSAGSMENQLLYGPSHTSVWGVEDSPVIVYKEEDDHRRPISRSLSLPNIFTSSSIANTSTSPRPFTCRKKQPLIIIEREDGGGRRRRPLPEPPWRN